MQITISLTGIYDWFMALGLGWQILLCVVGYLLITVAFAKILNWIFPAKSEEDQLTLSFVGFIWPGILPLFLILFSLFVFFSFLRILIFGRPR